MSGHFQPPTTLPAWIELAEPTPHPGKAPAPGWTLWRREHSCSCHSGSSPELSRRIAVYHSVEQTASTGDSDRDAVVWLSVDGNTKIGSCWKTDARECRQWDVILPAMTYQIPTVKQNNLIFYLERLLYNVRRRKHFVNSVTQRWYEYGTVLFKRTITCRAQSELFRHKKLLLL